MLLAARPRAPTYPARPGAPTPCPPLAPQPAPKGGPLPAARPAQLGQLYAHPAVLVRPRPQPAPAPHRRAPASRPAQRPPQRRPRHGAAGSGRPGGGAGLCLRKRSAAAGEQHGRPAKEQGTAGPGRELPAGRRDRGRAAAAGRRRGGAGRYGARSAERGARSAVAGAVPKPGSAALKRRRHRRPFAEADVRSAR